MKRVITAPLAPLAKKPEDRVAGYRPLDGDGGPWIEDYLKRGNRSIPRVATRLGHGDRLGAVRMRLGFGRDKYRVLPGLYAVGVPGRDSPVLVTANYKLTFDTLRKELEGIDAFILVIDTKGVNVWCAAGKGNFGTAELVAKIGRCRLGEVVAHRELILPQLGAPGVAAPEVKKLTGFRVLWGPVRARDIKAWLAAGKKKDASMSRVSFGLKERLILAPLELVHVWPAIIGAAVVGILSGLPFASGWEQRALAVAVVLEGALVAGTVAFPALLFVLPTRSFSIKGAFLGLVWSILAGFAFGLQPALVAGLALVSAATVAWIGLNFTGSTTFTSPTGALKEVERTIWPAIGGLATGTVLSVASLVFGV